MQNGNVWELPFSDRAQLELGTDWGGLSFVRVEPGQAPRLELTHGSAEQGSVRVEKVDDVVRVSIDRHGALNWFGAWDFRATVYVPSDVRAAVQTNAGSVSVRNLDGCELDIRAT